MAEEQGSNFVDNINDAASSAQQAYAKGRQMFNLGKAGAKLVSWTGKVEAASGSWMFFVIFLLFFSVLGIVMFAGAPGGVMGGDTTNSPSPTDSSGAPGTIPTCTSGNIVSCLKNDFNITVTNGTTAQMNDIYNVFALPFSYPLYKQLMANGGTPLTINLLSDGGGCHGWTPGPSINIYNYSYCQSFAFKNRQYLLIHESGHAINWRNPRVQQAFVSNAWNDDSACYQSGYLKTYPLRCGASCRITPSRESFAEAIADYVMCSGGGTCQYAGVGNAYSQPINNFPAACPVTNSWTGSNVY